MDNKKKANEYSCELTRKKKRINNSGSGRVSQLAIVKMLKQQKD